MAKKWFPYNNTEYVEECLKAYLDLLDLLDLLNKAITEKEKEKLKQKEEIQRASKVDTSN